MLAFNDLQVGMRFRSTQPVFRGDNIEFPTGSEFEIVQLKQNWIKLKCDEERHHTFVRPVLRPENEPEDYFQHVTLNYRIKHKII